MILSHMVAASRNNVIGKDNDLPWHIPEDLRYFREKTKHKALIMGRKTFDSVEHPLPHRLNVVITRNQNYKPDGCHCVQNLDQAISICKNQISKYGEEIFIIGGGQIFRETIDLVDRIYLTRIHRDYDGDIFYPEFDESKFTLVSRVDRTEPEPFSFLVYHRRI